MSWLYSKQITESKFNSIFDDKFELLIDIFTAIMYPILLIIHIDRPFSPLEYFAICVVSMFTIQYLILMFNEFSIRNTISDYGTPDVTQFPLELDTSKYTFFFGNYFTIGISAIVLASLVLTALNIIIYEATLGILYSATMYIRTARYIQVIDVLEWFKTNHDDETTD